MNDEAVKNFQFMFRGKVFSEEEVNDALSFWIEGEKSGIAPTPKMQELIDGLWGNF